jgi:hypothetical protein
VCAERSLVFLHQFYSNWHPINLKNRIKYYAEGNLGLLHPERAKEA